VTETASQWQAVPAVDADDGATVRPTQRLARVERDQPLAVERRAIRRPAVRALLHRGRAPVQAMEPGKVAEVPPVAKDIREVVAVVELEAARVAKVVALAATAVDVAAGTARRSRRVV
jgi:hypothetical protein